MYIFVECHLFDSLEALATNTQNFSRNVGTECRREIMKTGREIFLLSGSTLNHHLYRDERMVCKSKQVLLV